MTDVGNRPGIPRPAQGVRAPSPGQENVGRKGKKFGKRIGGNSERAVLRPLQPDITRSSRGNISLTATDMCTSKATHRNKTKVQRPNSSVKATDHVKDKNKELQTDVSVSLEYKMCTSEEPPLEYWKVLAEQRRQALAETLQENEELHTENQTLREKIIKLERRLEDKEYFAMMYQIVCDDSTQKS